MGIPPGAGTKPRFGGVHGFDDVLADMGEHGAERTCGELRALTAFAAHGQFTVTVVDLSLIHIDLLALHPARVRGPRNGRGPLYGQIAAGRLRRAACRTDAHPAHVPVHAARGFGQRHVRVGCRPSRVGLDVYKRQAHYSHRSHGSHGSHSSHQSHYSSRY